MSDVARIDSIDVLRSFRAALWKFAEDATLALGDGESELRRTQVWLETEQYAHWQNQIRIRREAVSAAREKVREKRLFKDVTGRPQSAVDEEIALKAAVRRLEEAEAKFASVQKWIRRLQHEIHNYTGGVQRLATMVASDLPAAVARLDRLTGALEKYVAAAPASVTSAAEPLPAGAGASRDLPSMARGQAAERAEQPAETQEAKGPPPGFPHIAPPQVAVASVAGDEPAAFTVFGSMGEAEQHARERLAAEPAAEFVIYDAAGQPLTRIPGTDGRVK